MSIIEIRVPDIGDFKQVEVIEILVKVGDLIKADQPLVTVESDKASMEIPASHAGVVTSITVKIGDQIAEGSVLLTIENVPQSAEGKIVENTPKLSTSAVLAEVKPVIAEAPVAPLNPAPVLSSTASVAPVASSGKTHASPSMRKYAREFGVDLAQVQGTAAKGRILQEDVQSFIKGIMQNPGNLAGGSVSPSARSELNLLPWPSLDFSKFGATELLPLSRIKKLSGPNLHRNWVMIPHVTQYDEADITELEAFRKSANELGAKSGVKMTMLAFAIKACVSALKQFPAFNSSLDASGEILILKQYYHIGFAADTPNGLMVPVIKDVDKKSLSQIATEMGELSAMAREGKLKPGDMQGATFTISSLGGIGSTGFTPIINAPEVAILGLSKAQFKPVWNGKEFQARLIMPMSLSYDHRVIDGAMGARFSGFLAQLLGDLRKCLL